VLLADSISIVPFLHGKIAFARHVRDLCLETKFDCIAVDIPQPFQDDFAGAVDRLPFICAMVARTATEPVYYVPIDPCDATIEGVRQSRQNRIPYTCVGFPVLSTPRPLPPLPDEYALNDIGFDNFTALCLHAVGNPEEGSDEDREGQYIAYRLHELRTRYKKILALVHIRHFVRVVHHFGIEKTHNLAFNAPQAPQIDICYINPDHLYFALGELPFVTGKFEKERYELFSGPTDPVTAVKDLFRETRNDYYDEPGQIVELSPARIQIALTFLRNLTVLSSRLIPSLPDIVEDRKSVV
jgi:hypothetical protein